jgi:hypothetical protein
MILAPRGEFAMQNATMLAAIIMVLAGGPVNAQEPKSAPAKVTISGAEKGTLTISDGVTMERFVLLEIDAKTTIKVVTMQDVTKFNEKMLAQARKMFDEFGVLAKKLAANNDVEGITKAQKEHEAASAELQSYFSYYAVEGGLTVVNAELRLAGQLRMFDYKGADKTLGKGKALVQGHATQVKFDAGQGPKMTLAIQNDNQPIVVTGLAAKDMSNIKGTIRVHGVLSLTKGVIVLESEKIELLKK